MNWDMYVDSLPLTIGQHAEISPTAVTDDDEEVPEIEVGDRITIESDSSPRAKGRVVAVGDGTIDIDVGGELSTLALDEEGTPSGQNSVPTTVWEVTA